MNKRPHWMSMAYMRNNMEFMIFYVIYVLVNLVGSTFILGRDHSGQGSEKGYKMKAWLKNFMVERCLLFSSNKDLQRPYF
jgi:hypothetical protein